jgi:uncharacterized protein YbjT (DUF2867 family)
MGNMAEPQTARTVFNGVEGVFLISPVGQTEAHEGLMAVTGMRTGGVKRVVYVSVQDADKGAFLPHFGAKVAIEQALKVSGLSHTILRPNNFYQNDYWLKDAILQYGVYPQPLGSRGVSRVDVRDIADAAIAALTSEGHNGQTYNLVGPRPLTGNDCAEGWSKALKKKIAYAGDDVDAWEKQNLAYLPPFMAYDFARMYAFFQEKGLRASAADIERQTKLTGHAPRSFEDFTKETAKVWGIAG